MKPEVMKGLLGLAIGAAAGVVLIKMTKAGDLDLVIDKDALAGFLPRQEKILNPNGEDLTIKSEPELIKLNTVINKEDA